MPKYKVQHDYRSGTAGPFFKGETVSLDAELAEWINRDCKGTLKEIKPRKRRQTKKPPQDRMVKAGTDRGE
jgi:hypothetical protein